MSFGFKKPTLQVETADGRNCVFLEDLIYVRKDGTTIRGRKGSTSDGGSTPSFVWNILPPFGRPWLSFNLHDCGYRGTLDFLDDGGNWVPIPLGVCNEAYCDSLLKEAMESQGVGFLEVEAVFEALKRFGWKAFSEDRAKPSA